jgi:hypothetical protein
MDDHLTECTESPFETAMGTYFETDDYKQETCRINNLYFELRGILALPEDQEKLSSLFNAIDNRGNATAEEAYRRGIIRGMSDRENTLHEADLEL